MGTHEEGDRAMKCPLRWCGKFYSIKKWFKRHIELHKEFHDGPWLPQGCRGEGHRGRSMMEFVKDWVYARDGGKCQICGRAVNGAHYAGDIPHEKWFPTEYEIHHIIPVSEGGANCMANLVTACLKCHRGGVRNRRFSTAKNSANLEDFA